MLLASKCSNHTTLSSFSFLCVSAPLREFLCSTTKEFPVTVYPIRIILRRADGRRSRGPGRGDFAGNFPRRLVPSRPPGRRRAHSRPLPVAGNRDADYPLRTEQNVLDSDATLILCRGQPGGGTELTLRLADRHGRPCLVVDPDAPPPPAEVADWSAPARSKSSTWPVRARARVPASPGRPSSSCGKCWGHDRPPRRVALAFRQCSRPALARRQCHPSDKQSFARRRRDAEEGRSEGRERYCSECCWPRNAPNPPHSPFFSFLCVSALLRESSLQYNCRPNRMTFSGKAYSSGPSSRAAFSTKRARAERDCQATRSIRADCST